MLSMLPSTGQRHLPRPQLTPHAGGAVLTGQQPCRQALASCRELEDPLHELKMQPSQPGSGEEVKDPQIEHNPTGYPPKAPPACPSQHAKIMVHMPGRSKHARLMTLTPAAASTQGLRSILRRMYAWGRRAWLWEAPPPML